MDYTQLMTHDEAAVLAAVLLDGGKDEKLMQVLHREVLRSEAAKCVAWAIRVLESKDLDVDVISVREYIRDSDSCKSEFPHAQPMMSIEILNSIILVVRSRTETNALVDSLIGSQDDQEE